MSLAMFGYVQKSLHIMSCPKDDVTYQGKCIVYCVNPNKNIYLFKKVWALWRPFYHIMQLHSQTVLAVILDIGLHLILVSQRSTGLLFSAWSILKYLPYFVIKPPYFVIMLVPLCNKVSSLCNTRPICRLFYIVPDLKSIFFNV